jgi:hypothetical protein
VYQVLNENKRLMKNGKMISTLDMLGINYSNGPDIEEVEEEIVELH